MVLLTLADPSPLLVCQVPSAGLTHSNGYDRFSKLILCLKKYLKGMLILADLGSVRLQTGRGQQERSGDQ